MNTLKPHLIPILLIGAQILNTLLVYVHNNSILWFYVALVVMTISLIGTLFPLAGKTIPYWQAFSFSKKQRIIISGIAAILLIGWGWLYMYSKEFTTFIWIFVLITCMLQIKDHR